MEEYMERTCRVIAAAAASRDSKNKHLKRTFTAAAVESSSPRT